MSAASVLTESLQTVCLRAGIRIFLGPSFDLGLGRALVLRGEQL